MSRLHRQKLRARARDEHAQFKRGEDPLLQDLVALKKQQVTSTPAPIKPSRAKRSRRKAVRKSKAKAKPMRKTKAKAKPK